MFKEDLKINLCIITRIYPPLTGGAATYYSLLVSVLKNYNFMRINLITKMVFGQPLISSDHSNVRVYRILLPGLTVTKELFLLSTITSFINRIIIYLWYLFMFKKDNSKKNILHLHEEAFVNLKSNINLFSTKSRLIVDFRGMNHLPNSKQDVLILKKYCDALICASENIYNKMVALNLEKISCHIPIPFDFLTRKKTKRKKDFLRKVRIYDIKPFICFIGNIHKRKGVFELIQAFEILKHELNVEIKLLFVGPNNIGKKFASLVRRINNIHWISSLPHEHTQYVINETEMICLPSLQEGLPRVCLEAIFLGKKFLGPASVPELKKNCPEFVIKTIKPDVLADRIVQILKSNKIPQYDFGIHELENNAHLMKNLYDDVSNISEVH